MTTTTDTMRTTTDTMRAVVQRGYGRPEDVLHHTTVPRPRPGPNQVLVRVHATSVNTPDWVTTVGEPMVLRLQNGLRRPRTPIRGTDLAGTVEEVGADVADLSPGDEVFGSAWANGLATPGTFCEYALAAADQLLLKPPGLPWVQAAASVMSGLTALIGIRDVARIQSGDKVLVNGASGGVGTFMVQLAAGLGAEVTAVCSARNAELVRSLGAEHVIDHTRSDFTRDAQRYDVVFDNVLNHTPSAVARVLTPAGLLVPNSVGRGGRLLGGLPRTARAMLLGRGSTRVSTITCEVTRHNLGELADLLVADELQVVVDRTYGLSQTPTAVAHMLSRRARGKIAITVP